MRQKYTLLLLISFFCIMSFRTTANAQITVQPVELYRFKVPSTTGGYFLTPNYLIGLQLQYQYTGVVGSIFVPPTGFLPNQFGLAPIHAWRVIQNSRIYYYYTHTYSQLGPDYTYIGIIGYMYDPTLNTATLPTIGGTSQTYNLNKTRRCYSQSYGYWYGILNFETAPNSTYNCGPEHGILGGWINTPRGTRPDAQINVPETAPWTQTDGLTKDEAAGASFIENIPETCDIEEENNCYSSGGNWDSESCYCNYP